MRPWVIVAGYVLSLSAIPHLLLSKKRPQATLAWCWFILLFPFIGAFAYFAIGADRMKRRRLRRAARKNFFSKSESENAKQLLESQGSEMRIFLHSLEVINQLPATTASSVRLVVDASSFYPALEEAIEHAQHHVHVEFFIWRDDATGRRFRDLLAAAAERGVAVRLLLDQIGCLGRSEEHTSELHH